MNRPRSTLRWRLLLCVFVLLVLTPVSAQQASSPAAVFYYANGEQIPLGISTAFITVRLEAAGGDAGANMDLLGSSFQSLDPVAAIQPALLSGYDFHLVPLNGVTGGDQAAALARSLALNPAVAWSNPVFTYGPATLILTNEFIAGFPTGTSFATIDAYNAANGVERVRDLSSDAYLLRVTSAEVSALEMANRYQTGGVARYGEPNFVVMAPRPDVAPVPAIEAPQAGPLFTPNDTYASFQWHINNTGQFTSATPDADIDGYEAWAITQGSADVIIAVLDDGMQINHPDLNDKVVSPRDVAVSPYDDDPTPGDTAEQLDVDAHGTHAAGVAAAETNNGIGVMGACPNCKLMPIRIAYTSFGSWLFTFVNIAAGVDWARTHGAHVLSNSWWVSPPSTTLTNAFSNAVYNGRGGLGSVVVIAALNTYQASVTYPGKLAAILPGMITVGASTWCDTIKAPNPPGDCSGETWWGNNWGTEVVVTAPGHSIYSPDLTGTDGYTSADYSYFNGTSAATPIVAGVAGLLLSQNPGWTNDQVRDRIAMTADEIYTAGYDIASGWGRVNAQKALSATITNTGRQGDHIADAQTINEVPAQISEAVAGAFRDRTDPTLTCLSSSQSYSSSLWFKFVPPYTMSATITTSGSTYNTVLAIYDSAMTSLACNNDTGGIQSQVVVNLNGGAAYYVLVGGYSTVSGPTGIADAVNLVLNITTATAAPGPLLTGTVTFQGRPPAPDADLSLPLHVLVKPTGGGVAVFDGSVSTNNFGAFALNLPVNTYDVWVKGERTLARLVTVDLSTNMSIDVGTLQEGDANGDNIVNIQDFSLLASAFGTQEGDAAYDVRADFNADGLVNIGDFSLLAASFAQVGAPAP